MSHNLNIRISENGRGGGWYWEVVTFDKSVVARGVAEVHATAREQASTAARDWNRNHWNGEFPPTPKMTPRV